MVRYCFISFNSQILWVLKPTLKECPQIAKINFYSLGYLKQKVLLNSIDNIYKIDFYMKYDIMLYHIITEEKKHYNDIMNTT